VAHRLLRMSAFAPMDAELGGEAEDQILSGVLSLSLTEAHGDPKVWIYLRAVCLDTVLGDETRRR